MENIYCKEKDDPYYNFEKARLISLIPQGPNVVLDLGCAAGRVGRRLKEMKKASEVVGVEIFVPAAEEAEKYYNKVYKGDIEAIDLEYRDYFDFVICGDILEHLRDPWATIDRIHQWLRKEGKLLVSIPNIRYWRVLRDLIFFGRFEYLEAGILDHTHLRFFTRTSFLNMLHRRNFVIDHQEMIIGGKKQAFFNRITLGFFQEFMGSQVMISARKKE
jgi:2-polyprenyl-3-methyl-5-hydroxy-6-metoxy-1,4-benzoquinol methylase